MEGVKLVGEVHNLKKLVGSVFGVTLLSRVSTHPKAALPKPQTAVEFISNDAPLLYRGCFRRRAGDGVLRRGVSSPRRHAAPQPRCACRGSPRPCVQDSAL